MVKSKFGVGWYLFLLFCLSLLIGIWLRVIYNPADLTENYNNDSLPLIAGVFGISLLALIGIGGLLKNTGVLFISPGEILVKGFLQKKKILAYDNIETIDMFAKSSSWLYFGEDYCTRIRLKDGTFVLFLDTYYGNYFEVKQALLEYFPDKIKPYRTVSPAKSPLTYKKIEGNPVFCFNSFLLGAMICFLSFLAIQTNKGSDFFLLAFIPIFAVGIGTQMHYFILDGNTFIVKNHYFPWKQKTYLLGDIMMVSRESPNRRSAALRIVTKDFKSKLFMAGSLRNRDWNELKNVLSAAGLTVW